MKPATIGDMVKALADATLPPSDRAFVATVLEISNGGKETHKLSSDEVDRVDGLYREYC